MASFGRTDRQEEIWEELNAIRATTLMGLLPTADWDEYAGTAVQKAIDIAAYDALVDEYVAIHTANDTRG